MLKGHNIELGAWSQIWERNLKMTKSINLKENIYKMFCRWYVRPEKLTKMYKNLSNKCWKCEKKVGSFYHMWWMCSRAKDFWKMIHEMIEKILGVKFTLTPEIFLLNILPATLEKNKDLLDFTPDNCS